MSTLEFQVVVVVVVPKSMFFMRCTSVFSEIGLPYKRLKMGGWMFYFFRISMRFACTKSGCIKSDEKLFLHFAVKPESFSKGTDARYTSKYLAEVTHQVGSKALSMVTETNGTNHFYSVNCI